MAEGGTHEHTVNVALGEVLQKLRRGSWEVDAETTGVLQDGGRPDVLVKDASGWPVVIEAELENHASAEKDAIKRLGKRPVGGEHAIETAIALVYPEAVRRQSDEALREAIRATDRFEYALYTLDDERGRERLPASGWLRGSVRELAMLVQRASTPPQRVGGLADKLEGGINDAAHGFSTLHPQFGEGRGHQLAEVLDQEDDKGGQTRRMAMAVLLNALVFHEALAQAEFPIQAQGRSRPVRSIDAFFTLEMMRPELLSEWDAILDKNYWPIFKIARDMIAPERMPIRTVNDTLRPLWFTARELVRGGVTRSHDLTGTVFQRLIADRKFLATYYTRPETAALLAGLALPLDRPPGGADWGDAETLKAVQIGDFACGTGTLLSAAYSRLSLLHELHGGNAEELHEPLMKEGLYGLDVLNIAVHLTAAMLASAHPATPFEGESLLTMPYGAQGDGEVAVGSLDLLAADVQASLVGEAAARTAGGREPEDVRDLVNRIGHGKFELVIMNPPFTRPTNHEGDHANVALPSYAAFDTTAAEQRQMSANVKALTKGAPSNGYAGLASYFTVLAHRKARADGTVAMVLPLSALSGRSWGGVRRRWRANYSEIMTVTIAGAGSYDSSFSADTGMAECLFVGVRSHSESRIQNPLILAGERCAPFSPNSLNPRSVANSSPPPSARRRGEACAVSKKVQRAERRSCSARSPAAMYWTAPCRKRDRGPLRASRTAR